MTQLWVILGATSIIAENFAHIAAEQGYPLLLVGRQQEQLNIIKKDITLRYKIECTLLTLNLSEQTDKLITFLQQENRSINLFIAHSDFTDNAHLNEQSINNLIKLNILSTTLLIDFYFKRQQKDYHLIFISSVAACRGRAKNSLYGASKACIETYLQGLQQAAKKNQHILIARLGFIDTKQTYGLPGIFYAASPSNCARACWNALKRKKRVIYYPLFWKVIMAIITRVPFFLYRRLSFL